MSRLELCRGFSVAWYVFFSLSFFSVTRSLTVLSKCNRSRRPSWMEYRFRCRISPHHDIQPHSAALLHSRFVQINDINSQFRELAYQSYIHCRCPRIPSTASDDREALLPPDYAGTITMPAAIPNQSQGPASVYQQQLGNRFNHRRAGTYLGRQLHHGAYNHVR